MLRDKVIWPAYKDSGTEWPNNLNVFKCFDKIYMIITIFLYILKENIFIERTMMVFFESIYPRLGNNSEAIGGHHYTAHNQSLTVQEISSANENYTCCRCVVVLAY